MTPYEELYLKRQRMDAVYPGHPITVALCIIRQFASLEEAHGRDPLTGFTRASTSGAIPGAGGNVALGLDVLDMLKKGESWENVVKFADEAWAGCDSQAEGGPSFFQPRDPQRFIDRWRQGQEQADTLKETFRAEVESWVKTP